MKISLSTEKKTKSNQCLVVCHHENKIINIAVAVICRSNLLFSICFLLLYSSRSIIFSSSDQVGFISSAIFVEQTVSTETDNSYLKLSSSVQALYNPQMKTKKPLCQIVLMNVIKYVQRNKP